MESEMLKLGQVFRTVHPDNLLPMATKKAVGARGDWFAEVDGERLPCVHEFWWEKRALTYNDTKLRSGPKPDELFEAIKALKRVILTKDTPKFERSEVVDVVAAIF
jgi:hypothetical protein